MFKLPQEIKNQISSYESVIKDYIDGKIPWARLAGIRVPWGNYSHRGGKIFMSRIRVCAGTLTPLQLKALAHCSKTYGNAILHITTRQDIQIHDVKIENIIKIHNYLKDFELSSRGGGGNTVRSITTCPSAGVCEKECFDTRLDVTSLSEYLLAQESSYNLPRKLKIAFSGCPDDCAGCLINDIGLFALKNNEKSAYRVYAGGGMGAKSALGEILEEFIERSDLGYVVSAIKNVFYKHGDRKNKHHNRLRFLIEDIGFAKFKEYYKEELKELKENEHIALRKDIFTYPEIKESSLPKEKDSDFEKFLKYNCVNQKQKGFILVKLRIPRGDLSADKIEALAGLASEFKDIEFRCSQEQNLYVTNIAKKDLYAFYQKIKNILSDFLYPQTLLDVVACKGSLTCNLGLCNSPALAEKIEELVRNEFLDREVFNKLSLKINGCPNSCGRAPVGIIALYGTARKVQGRAVPFYRLLLGGRVGLGASRLAKDTGILIPAKYVPAFLKDFLDKIEKDIDENSDIHKYILEKGGLLAQEIYQNYSYVPAYSDTKDFYIDWGRSEEFSLEGLGPGECGAGIIDVIESDLTEARIALSNAEKNYSAQDFKKALFLSARALLVVKGIDPKNEEEAFSGFKQKFIDAGIALGNYANLSEIWRSINEGLSLEAKKEKLAYAKKFYEYIQALYKTMDSAFNFPKAVAAAQEVKKEEIEKNSLLDLKGTPCPINYVKAKLFLENLNSGDILEIILDEGEPIKNVPRSLKEDGHTIISVDKVGEVYKVIVKKS